MSSYWISGSSKTKSTLNSKSEVVVSKAKLDLAGGKISIAVEASTHKAGADFAVQATTTGTLKYEAVKGSFYFHPESLVLTSVDMNAHKMSGWLLRTTQKGLDMTILKAAESALERIPVYTLPDTMKGNVTRLVLDDVQVQDGSVTAHLSFWRLTKAVLAYAILFVVAIAFGIALLLKPEFGLALVIFGSSVTGN